MSKFEYSKESDLSWVDSIPSNWKTERLKNVFDFRTGLSITKKNLQKVGVPCVSYGEIHSKFGFVLDPAVHPLKCVSEDYLNTSKKSLLKKGDFVFADTSEDVEGAGNFTYLNSNIPVFAGYHTIIAKPKIDFNFRYMAYLIDSMSYRSQFQSSVVGIKVYSITQGLLKRLFVYFPSLDEQTQIANYLDTKTTVIDKKVKLLEQKIIHYKAYRKSLINKTVTNGLDKSVKLKDSGIDWIGEIPEHWEVKRLKDLSVISTGDKNSEDFDFDGTYPFFVRSPDVKKINSYSYDEEAVLTAGDGDVGKVFHYINAKFDVHQRVYCIRKFKKKLNAKYLYYYMYSKFYNQAMINNSNSIVNSIRLPLLKNFEVVISNNNKEQQQIADFLDAKTTTIDNIVNNIETQITTLKELRKTLINEVVTGKVKVS